MGQHQYFQGFHNPNQIQFRSSATPEILHNEMVMEMANNWIHVNWLMARYKEGYLTELDQMEKSWWDFIGEHNVKLNELKDSNEFLEKYFREPIKAEIKE